VGIQKLSNAEILVIGCTSSVGLHLIKKLSDDQIHSIGIRRNASCLAQGAYHKCFALDILSQDLDDLIAQFKFKLLIHLAWITEPNTYRDSKENDLWYEKSVGILTKFLKTGGKRIVGIGSCAEYGFTSDMPIREDAPLLPYNRYSEAKVKLHEWLQTETKNYAWCRTFFQYGSSRPSSKLIPYVIHKLLIGEKVAIKRPTDMLDFIHEIDVANKIFKIAFSELLGPVNLGSGIGREIGVICKFVEKQIDSSRELIYFEPQAEKYSLVADPTLYLRNFPNEQLIDFDKSIKDIIDRSRLDSLG